MSISGTALVDAAPRAHSGAFPARTFLRLVVLLGGAVAALLVAAATASADDGPPASGLGATVGKALGRVAQAPAQVMPKKVVPPQVLTPKALPQKAIPPKLIPHETVTAPLHRIVQTKALAPVRKAVRAVAPEPLQQVTEKVTEAVEPVTEKVTQTVTHNLTRAVAPVTRAAENLQHSKAIPALDEVVDEVVSGAKGAASTAPTPSATRPPIRHRERTHVDAAPPAALGAPAVVPVFAPATVPHPRVHSGSQLQGAVPGTPTQLPDVPAAPAQGPVAQTSSGQTAGDLAVLDAALRGGSDGSTRLDAGDVGAPLSRALVVDTRPA